MKICLSVLFVWVCLFCGCTPRYVESGGVRYEALSEKEEQELVLEARILVKALRKNLTPVELRWAETQEPVVKIRYTGDRCGFAKILWQLPKKEIAVDFDGIFLTSRMNARIYTREVPPELIDYSKKGSVKKDQTVKKKKKRRL